MYDIKINNKPDYAEDCEFVVARECDGEFWFWGAYDDRSTANKAAWEIDGMVFQNTRGRG